MFAAVLGTRVVFGDSAETVAAPSTPTRAALDAGAGVEEVVGARVLREFRAHRVDEREVVNALGDMRE